MVKFQIIAVFLALLACHDSVLTQARKIKPLNTDTTLLPSSEKKLDSPMIPKHEVASFGESIADTNAFRPTSPGDSPGVGHKSAVEYEHMKAMIAVQSPDVRVQMKEGSKNGFKPTDPGHSPGVGHAYENRNGQN